MPSAARETRTITPSEGHSVGQLTALSTRLPPACAANCPSPWMRRSGRWDTPTSIRLTGRNTRSTGCRPGRHMGNTLASPTTALRMLIPSFSASLLGVRSASHTIPRTIRSGHRVTAAAPASSTRRSAGLSRVALRLPADFSVATGDSRSRSITPTTPCGCTTRLTT